MLFRSVVDDEEKIRTLLRRCLEIEGYDVREAGDAASMRAALAQGAVDLVTLDLNLGGENGLTLAAELRRETNIAIVIVSGKGDVIDRVVGLEIGADDYITKPFHLREVVARIRTVLRRASERVVDIGAEPGKPGSLQFGGWRVHPQTLEVFDPNGDGCALTSAEFRLLMVFLERPKRVLSRDQLMDRLGGPEWSPLDRTIDNRIARLRKKIEEEPARPRFIKTVRGVGYTFAADVTGV